MYDFDESQYPEEARYFKFASKDKKILLWILFKTMPAAKDGKVFIEKLKFSNNGGTNIK